MLVPDVRVGCDAIPSLEEAMSHFGLLPQEPSNHYHVHAAKEGSQFSLKHMSRA